MLEYSSWLLKTGSGAGTRPVSFTNDEPKAPNMAPGAAPAKESEGGAGVKNEGTPAKGSEGGAEVKKDGGEDCWAWGWGLGAGGGFDADAFIRIEEIGADQKDRLAGLSSLSLSHPFPVGLLPMSGLGFEERECNFRASARIAVAGCGVVDPPQSDNSE